MALAILKDDSGVPFGSLRNFANPSGLSSAAVSAIFTGVTTNGVMNLRGLMLVVGICHSLSFRYPCVPPPGFLVNVAHREYSIAFSIISGDGNCITSETWSARALP